MFVSLDVPNESVAPWTENTAYFASNVTVVDIFYKHISATNCAQVVLISQNFVVLIWCYTVPIAQRTCPCRIPPTFRPAFRLKHLPLGQQTLFALRVSSCNRVQRRTGCNFPPLVASRTQAKRDMAAIWVTNWFYRKPFTRHQALGVYPSPPP